MYSRLTSISIDESMIPIFWICAPALYFHIGRRSPPYIFRLFILRCTILLATARAPRARTRSQSTIHTAPLSLVASPKGDYANTNTNTKTDAKTNIKTKKYNSHGSPLPLPRGVVAALPFHLRLIQRQIQIHIQRHGQIQGQKSWAKNNQTPIHIQRHGQIQGQNSG